ncbi:MAG: peptide chain release factor N(5)-glutamine methyltransferase [Deltaproteobacteria bacterium]|nr:peptide chain release factor N(5)-glutamine methyltransferase [Deltaproteobacteria bacterium]
MNPERGNGGGDGAARPPGELWTVQRVLTWTANKFAERDKQPARLEAEVLLAHVLKMNRVSLYVNYERPLDPAELAAYRELVKRRLAGEPSAYLVGKQEFWALPLAVDARVLVPRRDTETLVETALELLGNSGVVAPRILDIGTGSGAIALALAKTRPDASVVATDVSADALEVAQVNAAALGLDDRVSFAEGDLAASASGPFNLVVSNPPYIRAGDLAGLMAEVRHEPRLALDGGADGLAVYRRLIPVAAGLLAEGGALALEIGAEQAAEVSALVSAAGLTAETRRDLARLDRVVIGRK